MNKKKFILVGAKPSSNPAQNPGGRLTASLGISAYAKKAGFELSVIDTSQPSFPVPPLHKRAFRGIGRILQLVKALGSNKISGVIIFSGGRYSFFERVFMSMLCRLFGAPNLFFVRSGHFVTDLQESKLFRHAVKLLIRVPTKIGALGKKWVSIFSGLGVDKGRIVLAPSWVPSHVPITEVPKKIVPGKPLHFIFVGWLVKEKGIYELLEAIEYLNGRYKFLFTFVGGGSLESLVSTRINSSGWGDDVVSVGWKSAEGVQEHLSAADVFVLPSYAEGFPNALLEAMANGLPAICSDVGGICDSVQDGFNGYIIPPKKVRPLVVAMQRYLEQPSLVALHSKRSIEVVREKHDLQINCRLIFDSFTT